MDADSADATLAALLEAREEVAARVTEFDSVAKDLADARGDADSDDEHDPEGSTIAWDRAAQEATAEGAREHLAEIDAAIARLRSGWDGRCADCGTLIPAERLAARPSADKCVPCASRKVRG